MDLTKLEQIRPFTYQIPASWRADMQVPARILGDHAILEAASADRSLE